MATIRSYRVVARESRHPFQDVGRCVPKLGHRMPLPSLCDQTLSFVLANLRFVDSAVEMLDRFLAMAMKIALGLLQMFPGVSHGF
jgi:hypothetical protein